MGNVAAKSGIPFKYSINTIDGQDIGTWEYTWSILDNQEGTLEQKGEISNNSINSNIVWVTWLRKTNINETFVLQCIVKTSSTCTNNVFINVTVDTEEILLTDIVYLSEDITPQAKIYNAINRYKACCVGATQIRFNVQGGHFLSDPSNINSSIGISVIKDTDNNGCATINVLWDGINQNKYSITAFGVSGNSLSSPSTIIEQIVGVTAITPVINADSIAIIGTDLTASVNYTLSDLNWSLFPIDYTLNIWYQLGSLITTNLVGDLDSDYIWGNPINLGGGTVGYYINNNRKIFTQTINIPSSYNRLTPIKYRFKLINIELVGPSSLQNCFISSNGFGLKGIGWNQDKEYNNDLILRFCATSDDFPILPFGQIINPPCSDNFQLGDIDIIAPPCIGFLNESNIILGNFKLWRQSLPNFSNIVYMSLEPILEHICYSGCLPPMLQFDSSICTITCLNKEPHFGQINSNYSICYCNIINKEPEHNNDPSPRISLCDSYLPIFNNISYYNPVSPRFDPTPNRTICYKVCNKIISDIKFQNDCELAMPISTINCYSNENIIPQLGLISGQGFYAPILNTNINLNCQSFPNPQYDNEFIPSIYIVDQSDIRLYNINMVGSLIPEFSRSRPICNCLSSTLSPEVTTLSDPQYNITFTCQRNNDIQFADLPKTWFTPNTVLRNTILLSCQINSTPGVETGLSNQITLSCQTWVFNPSFTISQVPGTKICHQLIIN